MVRVIFGLELLDLAAEGGGVGGDLPSLFGRQVIRRPEVDVDGVVRALEHLGHARFLPEVLGQGQGRPPLDRPVLAPLDDLAEEVSLDRDR